MKLKLDVIWHEFGHLFGYKLVESLGGKKRKIIELNLVQVEDKNPYIKTNCNDFIRGDENWNIFQKKLSIKFKNKGFYLQSIIKLMGAVFQIKNKIHKPSCSDFKEIFTNLHDRVSNDNITGHAGADFENVKSYLMDYEGNLNQNDMITFALYIYSILESENIFTLLKKNVTNFNSKYNGEYLSGDDLLRKELNDIGKIIEQSNLISLLNVKIEELEKKRKQCI